MLLEWLAAACVVGGAAIFAYLYHLHMLRFDTSHRPQVVHWPLYGVVDVYLKVSSVALVLACIFSNHWLLLELYHAPLMLLPGLAMAGLGMALLAAAMMTLGEQFSPAHQSRLPTRLVQSGPYRYIRHPIYSGNLLILLGLFVATGSLWLLINFVTLAAYYALAIAREEATISEHLDRYQYYMERTGRFLPSWRAVQRRLRARSRQRAG